MDLQIYFLHNDFLSLFGSLQKNFHWKEIDLWRPILISLFRFEFRCHFCEVEREKERIKKKLPLRRFH